ncbi:MAG: STAS domain-containing protein [Chloroflexi bacterium]|nr:STAS domain-containing protein [Chloroflexota bacterium]
MEITEKAYKRCLLLKVGGRIDHETAPDLEKRFDKIFKKGQYRLVVDLSDTGYISSAGLRALVSALKKARRFNRGDVRLAGLSPRLKETFQLVGFHHIFQIFDQVVDAVGSF